MAKRKTVFRQLNDRLHLWLGIGVGFFIIIISLTGCIYVFERDIRDITEKYRFVALKNKPYLLPSQLRAIAEKKSGVPATAVQYGVPGEAAAVTYTKQPQGFTYLYMNPYTGEILHEKILNRDFFRIVLAGHFYLWLPPAIGKPVVNIIVLIFVFLLISGIIMWWPKRWNKATRKKSFTINPKASCKRFNYDLHNVLGFYVLLVAFVIAVTGMVYGFEWFKKGYYYVVSGGKTFEATKRPLSDTTVVVSAVTNVPEDIVWLQVQKAYHPIKGMLQISLPQKQADAIMVTYNPERKTYYKRQFRYFDRYTGKEIIQETRKKNFGERVYAANYDIHVGAIAGMPGKILAFSASLICGSLPVTGFLIWRGRRKKQKRKLPKEASL